MRSNAPVARLVSRSTRALPRADHKFGQISMRIADRHMDDPLVRITEPEREPYGEVD